MRALVAYAGRDGATEGTAGHLAGEPIGTLWARDLPLLEAWPPLRRG